MEIDLDLTNYNNKLSFRPSFKCMHSHLSTSFKGDYQLTYSFVCLFIILSIILSFGFHCLVFVCLHECLRNNICLLSFREIFDFQIL